MKTLHGHHLLTISLVVIVAALMGSFAYNLITPPPKPEIAKELTPKEQEDTLFPDPNDTQSNDNQSSILGADASLPIAVVLEASSAAIFQEANTSSTIIASASANVVYLVVNKTNGWYQIFVDGKQGFIESNNVKEQSY